MKPFPEGFQLTIPVWLIGKGIEDLDGEERFNPVSKSMENAIGIFTKYDLANAAARDYAPNPDKPISGEPILIEQPLMEVDQASALYGLLGLLKEKGITHVRFNRSGSDQGYSIEIQRVRNAIAESIASDPMG